GTPSGVKSASCCCISFKLASFSLMLSNKRNGTSGFDRLHICNDLLLAESGFTHGDLLRGHNQYFGRSLKVNGLFHRDT
ncbi:hypothetical protein EOL10_29095, partial [Citrobacter freundii]